MVLGYLLLDHVLTSIMKMSHEHSSSITGMIHHMPSLYYSFNTLWNSNFWLDKEYYVTNKSHFMVMYTLAYFMYDVIFHMKHKFPLSSFRDWQMFVHAVACAVTYAYIFETKAYHFYGAAFLTWEASTPFLYLNNILVSMQKKDSLLYKANGCMFFLTFLAFRVLFGSYVFWWLVWHKIEVPLKVVGITLNGLNYMWMFLITKKLSKMFNEKIA